MSDNWMHFFPRDPLQPKPHWGSLRQALLRAGLILEPQGTDAPAKPNVAGPAPARVISDEERYQPGPLFDEMCDVPHARYGWSDTYFYPQDFGDRIGIEVGDNMMTPPGIPGTERVVEDWQTFFRAVDRGPRQALDRSGNGSGL